MAVDAASYDSPAATRPVVARERETTTMVSRDGERVEIPNDMSFGDLLDVINPLQHLPIIGTLYRNLTGDTLNPAARVMGGFLYGGVVGGLVSVTNAVIEQSSGKDVGDQVLASLGFGEDDHPAAPMAVATSTGGTVAASATGSPVVPSSGAAVNSPPQTLPQPAQTTAPQGPQMAAASTAAPSAAALQKAVADANGGASGPTRLSAAGPGPTLINSLSGGATPTPSKMPARDTPLASSALAKHSAPKFAAPMTGSTMVNAQAANGNAPSPATPEALSETMMRNLAKYEQSRKATQSATPALRVSG